MSTNALAGVGTTFSRGDGASAEAFTAIAEINSITGPNQSRETIDVTTLDSSGGYREFIASFRDAGEVTLAMNFTRDGWIAFQSDFARTNAQGAVNYQITFPDTGNTTFTFAAWVTSMSQATPTDDKITMDVTLKITGQITIAS